MRVVSSDLDAEVAGSSQGDALEIVVWRGQSSAPQQLEVVSWSAGWERSRQVQGEMTVTVADPDGRLAPYGPSDVLAPFGSRGMVSWASGSSGTRVSWGRWRIRRARPTTALRIYQPGGNPVRVLGGGLVSLTLTEDATSTLVKERLDAAVATTATCLGEVRALAAAVGIAVTIAEGVSDRGVPRGLVYSADRMSEIEDHIARCGATYRQAPDGSLEVIPQGLPPVWTIAGGEGGVLIDVTWELSDDGVYNAVTSTGTAEGGVQLVAREYATTGLTAYGGPYGRVVAFHNSPSGTFEGVASDARTVLASQRRTGTIVLPVTCLFHPALQVGDRVVIAGSTPTDDPIIGEVASIRVGSISGAGATPTASMELGVAVSTEDLERISRRVAILHG